MFFLDLSNDASDDMDKGAAQKAFDATATTWVYTEGNIDSRVRDLLDPDRGARSEDQKEVQAPAESALPASPQSENGADHDLIGPDLPGCVLSATDRPGERPVATDEGEYQGRPVGVVVLPDPASEDRVNVYVVDSSCAGTASDEPGAVLLRRDVPRP
ncbi:hypothetical protein AQ490_07515 [Wenjunlia vitaminophila]|uniref:Uncharacterized protein n=1 Tax=Wenjunlia vitaminophila TaxID=76728 RepID=A0A0T6LMJ9_WENVI|nr:hypothetical protein [Wenjunlia vitaminophila]KRV47310.1 hypothetical protein AQ490_07515 [Wenjunlia vitaminophila]